jgi:hypothetical protein
VLYSGLILRTARHDGSPHYCVRMFGMTCCYATNLFCGSRQSHIRDNIANGPLTNMHRVAYGPYRSRRGLELGNHHGHGFAA